MIDMVKVRKQIRYERKQKGLTQQELSEITGLDDSHISRIENGERHLHLEILVKICIALEIPLDRIVTLYRDKNNKIQVTRMQTKEIPRWQVNSQ